MAKTRSWRVPSRGVIQIAEVPGALGRLGVVTSCAQRPPYGIEQGIGPERLSEERDRAGLQGPLARFVVAVSSQNDRRNSGARGRQVPEQIEAIHPAHPQIE